MPLLFLPWPAPADAADNPALSPAAIEWSEPIKVASGEAYRGPWRMNESDFRFVDDPTVAFHRDGSVAVAWVDQSQKNVLFQVVDPDGNTRFDDPVNVSRSPDIFSWLPRIAFAPDAGNEVFILWQEIVFSGGTHGGETFFARSGDGGKIFSEPLNLSNTRAGAGKGRLDRNRWHNGSHDLDVCPDGVVYATWTEYEGALWLSRSTDNGATFSEPLHIAGDDAVPARGPSLATGPGGTVFLAWSVGETPDANIHFTRSTDRAISFETPREVHASEAHADSPKIAVDRDGNIHLVYAESPDGPFRRYELRYTASADGGNTFDAPRGIPGSRIGTESAHFPSVALDDNGHLYLVWELFPDPRGRPQGLGFSVSKDGGNRFSTPAVVPGTVDVPRAFNGSQQGLLMRKIAVGGNGEFAVINSTFTPGVESRIRLYPGTAAAAADDR